MRQAGHPTCLGFRHPSWERQGPGAWRGGSRSCFPATESSVPSPRSGGGRGLECWGAGRGREVGGRSWVAETPAGGPGHTPPPRRWPPGAAPGGPRRQQALALLAPNGSQSPPAPILTVRSWTTAATPCLFVGAREVRGHETGTLAALRRSQLNVTLREGDTRGAKGHGRRGRAVSSGLCEEVLVQPRFGGFAASDQERRREGRVRQREQRVQGPEVGKNAVDVSPPPAELVSVGSREATDVGLGQGHGGGGPQRPREGVGVQRSSRPGRRVKAGAV